jgi:cation diffusion facilitator CzcD-associated flavoprotein CzcO
MAAPASTGENGAATMSTGGMRVASRTGDRAGWRIGIIGAGPGGLCAAIRLRQEGYTDVVVWERADGVGGTWRRNSYPGCACDIPSHLYCFSFEPKVDWSRPYATQPEILDYLEHCVDAYGLDPFLRLGCGVSAARWDDADGAWHVTTDDGQVTTVDVLVSALGMFNDLVEPDLPGLDAFAGVVFHSARWDHGHDLAGERVAVVGSAASAVQLVPEVAKIAGRLSVFQRSPNWVAPKDDTPFTPEQLERFRTDPAAAQAERDKIWGWVDVAQTFASAEMREAARQRGLANLALVEDPDVRRRLTPSYAYGCKRPLISNDWYPAFNRPNVELVTEPITKVTADAIVTADGRERSFDTIVLATGFETTRFLSSIEVTGRHGRRLDDAWADGAQAYLGVTTSGFPNLFMLYGPNTNNGSIIFQIECQVAYLLRQLDRLDREGLTWMDVKQDVMDDYNRRLQDDLDHVEVWSADACHNYYRNGAGRIVTQWPHGMGKYREWTSAPDPDAYEVS